MANNNKPNINRQTEKKSNVYLIPNDKLFSQYVIVKQLTEGGMNSVIYVAKNIMAETDKINGAKKSLVVVKIVKKNPADSEDKWTKLRQELITSSRISHPNLITTYDISDNELIFERNNHIVKIKDIVVIVMEYVQGVTLRKHISTKGSLSVKEALYYFRRMVEGIQKLHNYSHQIIHRDLKPENLMLSKDFRELKIIDFGIASSITTDAALKILTNEQALFGTEDYMCPDVLDKEIVRDENNKPLINPKTNGPLLRRTRPTVQYDFYSFGVILFEMITGQKPFNKQNKKGQDVIKLPNQYDVPLMKTMGFDVPNSVENIVFRCMASKKEDRKYRYSSCEDILKDLDNVDKEQALIKPYEKRVLQKDELFKPTEITVDSEPIIFKYWSFWLITGLVILIVLLTLGLIIFNFLSPPK
ncbi:serine/threonine protein kinase [Mycoplasma sp. T363T]|uniref:serine/threonine protein kinase n=1 Tax=Mycoplasma bradburyae TaxID=2963128 RepID=UPI0023417D96|nr:serine/threonine-protein kinase [Mycoplasma bradburyae]MDC4163584.1 serine/threonine protein kinase [Mycoplasma bradburyae]